jgi:hypothetical protein
MEAATDNNENPNDVANSEDNLPELIPPNDVANSDDDLPELVPEDELPDHLVRPGKTAVLFICWVLYLLIRKSKWQKQKRSSRHAHWHWTV